MHVVFVCTGNICRSPMAALVFSEHLRRAGLVKRVRVSSAGTGPWHAGQPADRRARRVLAANGYPTDHVAAQVSEEDLTADLLVALDSEHADTLHRLGVSPARVRMLRSFDPAADGLEVLDPYYGGAQGFQQVLSEVEGAMPGLLDWVREQVRG